jgi:hypothetical protein
MSQDTASLSLLLFPQRWDGHRLSASLLVLPRGDPLHAPLWAEGLAFAGAPLALRLELQAGGSTFTPLAPGHLSAEFTLQPAARAVELFTSLHDQFLPTPPPSSVEALWRWREQRRARWAALGPVRKVLPDSYRAAMRHAPATDGARGPAATLSQADFANRLVHASSDGAPSATHQLCWGEVLSHALRQPALARALGLVIDIDTDFTGWDVTTLLSQGGWLRVTLAAPQRHGALSLATWIPHLSHTPRPLFAAVLFPANGAHPPDAALLAEAQTYSDGFARVVHSAESQPLGASLAVPGLDAGVSIGWDDEQVLAWVQRQIDALCHPEQTHGLPGVAGYRVDVRERDPPTAAWRSLCGVRGTLSVGAWHSEFIGESRVDVAPQLAGRGDAAFAYLPRHFATWRGGSLVAGMSGRWAAQPWPLDQPLPVLRPGVPCDFRVRLVDLSGGGAQLDDEPVVHSAAQAAS